MRGTSPRLPAAYIRSGAIYFTVVRHREICEIGYWWSQLSQLPHVSSKVRLKSEANKARLDNRWGFLLFFHDFQNFNINRAIDAHTRPSGATS